MKSIEQMAEESGDDLRTVRDEDCSPTAEDYLVAADCLEENGFEQVALVLRGWANGIEVRFFG